MSFIKAKAKSIQKRQIQGIDYIYGSSSLTNEQGVADSILTNEVKLPAGENITANYPVYVENGIAYLCDGLHECMYFSKETKTSGNSIVLIKEGLIAPIITVFEGMTIYLNESGGFTQENKKVKGKFFQEIGDYETGYIRINIREGFLVLA